jgi:hypothetical protein
MQKWTFGYSDKQSQNKPNLSQNKPNLSQNKPNSKPIWQKAKSDAKCAYTKDYEEKCGYGP